MNKNDQDFLVQKIRTQYTEKAHTQLDELKELDAKVKRPANIFAYIFGTIGALVLGTGMCLAMKIIGDAMISGVIIGCVGIAMVSLTYSVHKALLNSRRKNYADRIMSLSEQIMGNR